MFERICIEVTNSCNMRCSFCPNPTLKRQRYSLPFNLFKAIIDDMVCNNLSSTVSFTGNGEPFLDVELGHKLEYCKEHGLKVVVTTNGLLLNKAEFLIDRVDALYISWQTINGNSFALRRANDWDYAAYENNIIEYLKRVVKINACSPEIYLSIMLNAHLPKLMRALMADRFDSLLNQDELQLMKVLERMHYAIREIRGENLSTLQKRIIADIRKGIVKIHLLNNIFFHIGQLHEWGGLLLETSDSFCKLPTEQGTCRLMLAGPQIMADGNVALCCIDAEGCTKIGSVENEKLSNVLRAKAYSESYNGFKQGVVFQEYCKKCKGLWRHRSLFRNILFFLEDQSACLGERL